MPGFDVDVSELRGLAVSLATADVAMEAKLRQALVKTGYDIERDAKAVCPVDTGFLRNSIFTTVEDNQVEVGPSANYGGFVEYGTTRMAPQPYMGPAFEKNVPPFLEAVVTVSGDLL